MMKRDEAETLLSEYTKSITDGTTARMLAREQNFYDIKYRLERESKEILEKAEQIRLKLLIELIS